MANNNSILVNDVVCCVFEGLGLYQYLLFFFSYALFIYLRIIKFVYTHLLSPTRASYFLFMSCIYVTFIYALLDLINFLV